MVSTRPVLCAAALLSAANLLFAAIPADYPGMPYQGKVQEIPGRVFLSDFDQGPKNVVWHDYNTKNQWACKVRDSTGVGMQLMGQGGDKGDTPEADSLVKARMGKCYLAETNTGDWTKYTVKVKQAGTYKLAMLSAAQGTTIPFVAVSLLTAKDSMGTGQLTLPLTTYFHHWVYTRNLSSLSLDSGTQVLRFDIPGNGPMNIDYIDFEYAGAADVKRAAVSGDVIRVSRMARQADGSVVLEFAASGRAGVGIRAFDASGALLASETAAVPGASGKGRLQLRNLPASGLVFVELRQGSQRALARTFLAAP
jgi:hypothetical protein